jgi:hypothetical protein
MMRLNVCWSCYQHENPDASRATFDALTPEKRTSYNRPPRIAAAPLNLQVGEFYARVSFAAPPRHVRVMRSTAEAHPMICFLAV